MEEQLDKLSTRVSVALVVCLCFLLSSTSYLSWVYHLVRIAGAAHIEFLTMVCGYLAQALGIGLHAFLAAYDEAQEGKRLLLLALLLHIVVLVPAALSTHIVPVLVFGLVANVLYGIMQGYYLALLCTRVDPGCRGTVFGCGYGLSTLLTWLLSLPADGYLTHGLACIANCMIMSICIGGLLWVSDSHMTVTIPGVLPVCSWPKKTSGSRTMGTDGGRRVSQGIWAFGEESNDAGAIAVICSTIVAASLVKTAGFAFPIEDLAGGVNLELTRILYGLGLVIIGVASDYDRRLGLAVCGVSLVTPFLMLALSGAGVSGTLLWLLGYLITGIYVLVSVLLTVDLADATHKVYLAGLGMLLRHVGDALGTALYLALASRPVILIAVTAVIFAMTAALFLVLYQRLLSAGVSGQLASASEVRKPSTNLASQEALPPKGSMLREKAPLGASSPAESAGLGSAAETPQNTTEPGAQEATAPKASSVSEPMRPLATEREQLPRGELEASSTPSGEPTSERAESQGLSPEQQERRHFERFSSTYDLSARERDVLRLVLEEKSNPEIAGALVITERTVKFHVSNLLRKTGCKTRREIKAKYVEQTI